MKKVLFATIGYIVFMIAISVINHAVLMQFYGEDFFYTIEGMKIATIVIAVEAIAIVPISKVYFMKVLGEKRFYKIFGEKEEKES